MTHKEINPIRISPPSRWDELDDGAEEHPIDIIIRETVTPWPGESRIVGLQAILAEEVGLEGRRVLMELEQINGDITREIKELAYDLGFADGLLAGRREHLADLDDPYLTALSERLHRVIIETAGPPRMLAVALMSVLAGVLMDLDGAGEKARPPDDTNV